MRRSSLGIACRAPQIEEEGTIRRLREVHLARVQRKAGKIVKDRALTGEHVGGRSKLAERFRRPVHADESARQALTSESLVLRPLLSEPCDLLPQNRGHLVPSLERLERLEQPTLQSLVVRSPSNRELQEGRGLLRLSELRLQDFTGFSHQRKRLGQRIDAKGL